MVWGVIVAFILSDRPLFVVIRRPQNPFALHGRTHSAREAGKLINNASKLQESGELRALEAGSDSAQYNAPWYCIETSDRCMCCDKLVVWGNLLRILCQGNDDTM